MKKNQFKLAVLVIVLWFGSGINFEIASAQESKRERVIAKPTPTTTATPKPTVSPTSTPSPTPISTPIPIQTVADLQTKIRLALSRPELRRGNIGIKIVSLDTNKTIFEENAEKYFMPASNMKNYTVAAALEKLSPDFRFVTSVYAAASPDASGTIRGDLTIFGRGDVSFSPAFYENDATFNLNALADKIVAAGVKRIEGNLVGDESYFTGNPIPISWEWDDLQWKSGAEISALPVNDNLVSLSVKPTSPNAPCAVQITPANAVMKIVNRCVTSSSTNDLQILKRLDQNILEISGSLPVSDKDGFENYVTVSRPAQLFVEMLRGVLLKKGVTITGQNKIVTAKDKLILPNVPVVAPVEIAKIESPPLSVVAAKTLKPSQNTYTETILWSLGEQSKLNPLLNSVSKTTGKNPLLDAKSTSAEKGLFVVQNFLKEIGITSDSVIQYDGSGLSRHNLITPASAVQLYTFMSKSRYAAVWRDALTIGAVDGTLKNRFKNTVAAGNVRGKTGTIDQVSTLSGYVNTATGERLTFSILVNGVASSRTRQSTIDEIVVALAAFNGKTQ